MKTIAQRQGDMVRAAMEDFSKHGSDVLGAATVEEKAAKQIDFAKKSYEAAIANTKELADLYSKGQTEAFAALSAPRRRADRRGQGRDRQEVSRTALAPNGKRGRFKGGPFCLSRLQCAMDQITYDDFEQGRHPRRHHPRRRSRSRARASRRFGWRSISGPRSASRNPRPSSPCTTRPRAWSAARSRRWSTSRRARSASSCREVLTLGFPDDDGAVVLVVPDKTVPNGGKLF